ncbi:TetR family transcriptional regulator [Planosporangium sp. 12N6]|uniref:TetR family transcriptional regulator n=1 Tax=Planosporangium spinosum TaxID=3402278 RepID=UPI003CFB84D1
METTARYRDTARQRMREAIIDAARDLTVAVGWDAVRMADVAARVGVSRQTVYNEFSSKAGLAEALAEAETDRFVAGVRDALYAHEDVRTAAHAAIFRVLTEAAGNPLIKAILTSARDGADPLLPYLTTRSERVLAAATAVLGEWVADRLPGLPADAVAFGGESIIRLVVSHIVLPLAPVDQTAAALADLAVRFIADPVIPAPSISESSTPAPSTPAPSAPEPLSVPEPPSAPAGAARRSADVTPLTLRRQARRRWWSYRPRTTARDGRPPPGTL